MNYVKPGKSSKSLSGIVSSLMIQSNALDRSSAQTKIYLQNNHLLFFLFFLLLHVTWVFYFHSLLSRITFVLYHYLLKPSIFQFQSIYSSILTQYCPHHAILMRLVVYLIILHQNKCLSHIFLSYHQNNWKFMEFLKPCYQMLYRRTSEYVHIYEIAG